MAFKKVTDSQTDGMYIIGSSDKNRYPVGFEYMVGGTTYTVREDVTKDTGSEMRRVITSDGSTEIMTLESIDADLKEPDAMIINDGLPEKTEDVNQEESKEPEDKTTVDKENKDEFEGLDW